MGFRCQCLEAMRDVYDYRTTQLICRSREPEGERILRLGGQNGTKNGVLPIGESSHDRQRNGPALVITEDDGIRPNGCRCMRGQYGNARYIHGFDGKGDVDSDHDGVHDPGSGYQGDDIVMLSASLFSCDGVGHHGPGARRKSGIAQGDIRASACRGYPVDPDLPRSPIRIWNIEVQSTSCRILQSDDRRVRWIMSAVTRRRWSDNECP